MAKRLNLTIRQGETFQRVIRWEKPPYIYKPITAITNAAPASITAASHNLTTGWRAAVVSVEGMTEINALHLPPRDSEMVQVTVVDPDTVTLNSVNSSDFSPYVSGGYLQYYTPVDLTGFSAKMEIKDRIGGTILMTISTGADGRIVLDSTEHTITVTIAAADLISPLVPWTRGVYDLEMTSIGGVVTTLYTGNVVVTQEVTT